MIRKSLTNWVAMLLLAVSGCSSINDCIVDYEMDCRNHILAQKAWGEWSWCYDELDHPWHFAKGFKDGYRAILEGDSGCQPTLPPKCYWKPQFQNATGRSMTNAWFDGYAHGALAAQKDGYGNLQQIPISPTARMNLNSIHAAPPVDPYHKNPVEDPLSEQIQIPPGAELAPPASEIPEALLPTVGADGQVEPVPPRPYEE